MKVFILVIALLMNDGSMQVGALVPGSQAANTKENCEGYAAMLALQLASEPMVKQVKVECIENEVNNLFTGA